MGIKYNTIQNVLKARSGGFHLALAYDLGIIHDEQDLENIHGFYSETKQGWVIRKRPYYSTGGWGSGSSGDRSGHYIYDCVSLILRVIGATIFETNAEDISDLANLAAMQEKTNKILKLKAEAKKLGLNPRLSDLEGSGLKFEKCKNHYDDETKPLNKGKGFNPEETFNSYKSAVEVFLAGKGKTAKVDQYRISSSEIYLGETLVAFKTSEGKIVLNSQRLNCSDFESKVLGGQSIVQKLVREASSLSVPLNVLASAGLKLAETKVVEQGPEEDFTIGGQEMHFTGAMLLENSGRKFLMDLDRREVEHGIWNPFFCEVSKDAKSIAEAYESMIPESVKTAMKNGVEVLRQGEWFFIDSGKTLKLDKDQVHTWESDETKEKLCAVRSQIAHGKGRPNTLYIVRNHEDASLNGLACGVVEHTGREHAPLCLGGKIFEEENRYDAKNPKIIEKELTPKSHFYIAESFELRLWTVVPNTTVSNFTIQGDID
mgnify:CR=1 FL=1